MKKNTFIALVCVFAFITAQAVFADEPPRRQATTVDDVFEPYAADEWIVTPDEEPTGDQRAKGYPECDIYGIIGCCDDDYLRVDILVNSEIRLYASTFFAIMFEYEGMNEYYTYYTDNERFVYEKEKSGKIVQTKVLTKDTTGDVVGITDSGDEANADVYFIINKKNHIGGVKGNEYFLTCTFFSGYVDANNNLVIADRTIPVDLQFTF